MGRGVRRDDEEENAYSSTNVAVSAMLAREVR
jgi:hypothetical protein